MAKDIEDFLRRAAERRRQQQDKQVPQQTRPTPPRPAPRPVPPQPTRDAPPRRLQPVEAIIVDDVEIIDEVIDLRDQSVQDHVKSHINTSDIAEHAKALGSRISGVAKQVETRVHQHLDHDISKVDDRETITDDQPKAIFGAKNNPVAAKLRKMLSNPQDVGNAIFLAEILKRPDWD